MIRRVVGLVALLGLSGLGSPELYGTMITPEIPPTVYVPMPTVPSTTQPTYPLAVKTDYMRLPSKMLCPEWAQLMSDSHWPESRIKELDSIMWRESRCQTMAHYDLDPASGSYGLMQINGSWCKPNRWFPDGYLQSLGILSDCSDLYNPRTNLIAARVIFAYSLVKYGDGWLPWNP